MAKTIGMVAVAALSGAAQTVGGAGEQHRHLPLDQFGRQRRQLIEPPVSPAKFDRDVLALDKTAFAERSGETPPQVPHGGWRTAAEETDHRHRRLLRARRERPRRRRAAEQRDELAPLHSITSSARASSVGGTVEAERLGGLEVDHQLVLGRRLHRQIGRLLALEDAIDVAGRAPVLSSVIRPVGDQAAGGRRSSGM